MASITGDIAVIPPDFAASGVDTSQPGFIANVTQLTTAQSGSDFLHGNNSAGAETQLAGEFTQPDGTPYINEAGPFSATDWQITPVQIDGVINWDQAAAAQGNFTDANGYPEDLIPGIPGFNDSTDAIAAEILTFLELDRGLYTFGVNSDDGFKVTTAPNPKDKAAVELGVFEGGRGAADTLFDVIVREKGTYPIRTLWYEGLGGANIEFFTVHEGQKILVNDTSNPNAVRAYRVGELRPFVSSVSPVGAGLADSVRFEIVDGDIPVADGSVKLRVDGQDVTAGADFSKSGDVTTVSYMHPDGAFAGGPHTVRLSYDEASDPVFTRVLDHSFSVPRGQKIVLEDNPVLYWRLGETIGSTAISEVNFGLDGAYQSGVVGDLPQLGSERLVVGDASASVRFDRSQANIVRAPDHADTNNGNGPWQFRTIELWFKATSLPALVDGVPERFTIFEEGGGTRGLNIYLSGVNANATEADLIYQGWNIAEESWGGTAQPVLVSASGITTDTLYHAVMVMEGDTVDFFGTLSGYLDGEKVGEVPGVHLLYNHGDDLAIGGIGQNAYYHDTGVRSCDNCDNFDGFIDEFAVYNSALTESQIKAHFDAGNTEVPMDVSGGGGAATISAARGAAGTIQIEFTGTLQSASSVTGPWSDVADGSPVSINTSQGNMQFFRARQ